MALTIQSNIKNHTNDNLTNYALFMGGINVTHDVLMNYDPLITGYGRLFMVRQPVFVTQAIPTQFKKFKHILEYANTSVTGISDASMQFENMKGGYAGRGVDIPTVSDDGTTSFSVKVYEFSGSPVREVVHTWINGVADFLTALSHYDGVDEGIARTSANQTAEFIYVATDRTGKQVEYACMFANCFPKGINNDVYNYNAGEHGLVETQIEFSCMKYESIQINKVAKALLDRYTVLANSLNFYSGINATDDDLGAGTHYDIATGKLADGTGVNTEIPSNDIDATAG